MLFRSEDRVRTEVAWELHDVVAHSLSVIVVQTQRVVLGIKGQGAFRPDQEIQVIVFGQPRRQIEITGYGRLLEDGPAPSSRR